MKTFRLAADFTDADAERSLIAALAADPDRYWQLLDLLPRDAFAEERLAWQQLADAITAEATPPAVDPTWAPATDPPATAERLADLYQRRLLAEAQERLAEALYDATRPATAIASLLEAEAARVQSAIKETQAGRLLWASDLLPAVLQDAEDRQQSRLLTGKAAMGLPTSISKLDRVLNGLNPGLHILAGPPGVGKTSLATQIAGAVAEAGEPTLYVSFENSPANLTLKAICAKAQVNPLDVQRGYADLAALRAGAKAWRPIAGRLAFIEGSGRLTLAEVLGRARQAMARHKADRCLIVIDYVQLMAKAAGSASTATVREKVETLGASLRELAMRLDSPVLALSSQNRAAGDYGTGGGKAALDSLKESGDLEYAADSVLFLTPADKRTATPPARPVDLTIAKNRHGDTSRAELIFRPDLATLRELAKP